MPAQVVQVEPFVVSVYSIPSNGARMQLLVVQTERLKSKLLHQALKIGGKQFGDWVGLPDDAGLDDLDKVTNVMGGVIYDLVLRSQA